MSAFRVCRRWCAVAVLAAVAVGCSSSSRRTEKADPTTSACAAYSAAYDACFDKLGPAARQVGDRALEAANARFRAGEVPDPKLEARCAQATKRLAAACR